MGHNTSDLVQAGKVCGCCTTTPCPPREKPMEGDAHTWLGRIPCLRSRHVLAGARITFNNNTMPLQQKSKKPYYRLKNRHSVNIRLNPEQESLLEIQMREGGWEKASSYIKYKQGLVGDKEEIVDQIIRTNNPESILILLKNEVVKLAEQTIYFNQIMITMIEQIREESHPDVKKYSSSIIKMHSKLLTQYKEALRIIRSIQSELGGEEEDVNLPEIDSQNPSLKSLISAVEMIQLSRQLH